MIGRPKGRKKNTRAVDPSLRPLPNDIAATLTVAAGKLRVTCTEPIQIATGCKITVQGVAPTALTSVSPLVVDLTYGAAVVATNIAIIPDHDPGIRTQRGGYLQPQTKTLA